MVSYSKRLKMFFLAQGPVPKVRITLLKKVLTTGTRCISHKGSRCVVVVVVNLRIAVEKTHVVDSDTTLRGAHTDTACFYPHSPDQV